MGTILGLCNKDYSILVSRFGSPYLAKLPYDNAVLGMRTVTGYYQGKGFNTQHD